MKKYKIECDDTILENEVDLKDSNGKTIGKILNVKPMQVKTLRHNPEGMETDVEFIERIEKTQSPSRKYHAIDRVYNAGEAFIKGFNSGLGKE